MKTSTSQRPHLLSRSTTTTTTSKAGGSNNKENESAANELEELDLLKRRPLASSKIEFQIPVNNAKVQIMPSAPQIPQAPKMTRAELREALAAKALSSSSAVAGSGAGGTRLADTGAIAVAIEHRHPLGSLGISKVKKAVETMDQPLSKTLEGDLMKERKKRMDLEAEIADQRKETIRMKAHGVQMMKELEHAKAIIKSKQSQITNQEDGRMYKMNLEKLAEAHKSLKEKHTEELDMAKKELDKVRKDCERCAVDLRAEKDLVNTLNVEMDETKRTLGRMTLRQQELEDQDQSWRSQVQKQGLEIFREKERVEKLEALLEVERKGRHEEQLAGEKSTQKEFSDLNERLVKDHARHQEELQIFRTRLEKVNIDRDSSVTSLQAENNDLRVLLQVSSIEYAKLWQTRRMENQAYKLRIESLERESRTQKDDLEIISADHVRLQQDRNDQKARIRILKQCVEEVEESQMSCQPERYSQLVVDYLAAVPCSRSETTEPEPTKLTLSNLRDELAVAELKRRHHKLAQVYAMEQLHAARADISTLEHLLEESQQDYLDLKAQLDTSKSSASSEKHQRSELHRQIEGLEASQMVLKRERQRALDSEDSVREEYAVLSEKLRETSEREEQKVFEVKRLLSEMSMKEAGIRQLESEVDRCVQLTAVF